MFMWKTFISLLYQKSFFQTFQIDQKNKLLTNNQSQLNFFKSLHTAHESFSLLGNQKKLIEKIQTEYLNSTLNAFL